MTKLCTLTGQQYRAAFACKATAKDVRYYLTGVCLSAQHHELVSTNGHMMYTTPAEYHFERDLVFEPAKIPANAESVDIDLLDDTSVKVSTTLKHGSPGPQFVCKVIDCTYPDYKAVMDRQDVPCDDLSKSGFSFSAGRLSDLKTIFGDLPLIFKMTSNTTPAHITCSKLPGEVVLMPCKV